MLKHFAAATLGFAVLFGAAGPAAADKSGHYWKHPSPYVYSYGGPSYAYGAVAEIPVALRKVSAEYQARPRDGVGVAQSAALSGSTKLAQLSPFESMKLAASACATH